MRTFGASLKVTVTRKGYDPSDVPGENFRMSIDGSLTDSAGMIGSVLPMAGDLLKIQFDDVGVKGFEVTIF